MVFTGVCNAGTYQTYSPKNKSNVVYTWRAYPVPDVFWNNIGREGETPYVFDF
jgi:hypothetical protein